MEEVKKIENQFLQIENKTKKGVKKLKYINEENYMKINFILKM